MAELETHAGDCGPGASQVIGVQAIDLPCPYCKAKPGEVCRDENDGKPTAHESREPDDPCTTEPVAFGANLDEVVRRTKTMSLIDALVHVAIWENDRAVRQALRGDRDPNTGQLWDTCFRRCFEAVLEQHPRTDYPSRMQAIASHVQAAKGGLIEPRVALQRISQALDSDSPGHTCDPPGDTAEDIDAVAYDLRCAACVALRIASEGPLLPVGQPLLPRPETARSGVSCPDGTDAGEPSDRGFVCEHQNEADRLRIMFLECWVCNAALQEPTEPPHCTDCSIGEEPYHAWEEWLSNTKAAETGGTGDV